MSTLKENIDAVVNSALRAYEATCNARSLEILDDMHHNGILDNKSYFEYRQKFKDMYAAGREKLWQS